MKGKEEDVDRIRGGKTVLKRRQGFASSTRAAETGQDGNVGWLVG